MRKRADTGTSKVAPPRPGPAMRILLPLLALAAAAPAGAQIFRDEPQPGQERVMRPAPIAPVFVSPMGEPFREGSREAGLERWFAATDRDRDGQLSLDELNADAARVFVSLDVDGDGEIEPSEIIRYERDVAPEIQLGGMDRGPGQRGQRRMVWRRSGAPSGGGSRNHDNGDRPGLQGAGLYGLLNIPEPVMDADADLNRGVSAVEFRAAAGQRFLLLDTGRDGRLGLEELRAQLPALPAPRGGKRRH